MRLTKEQLMGFSRAVDDALFEYSRTLDMPEWYCPECRRLVELPNEHAPECPSHLPRRSVREAERALQSAEVERRRRVREARAGLMR